METTMTAKKFNKNRMQNTAKIASRLVVVQRDFYGRPLTEKELDATTIMAEEIAIMLPEDVRISDVHRADVEEIIAYIHFKSQLPANPTIWQRIKYWWKTTTPAKRVRVLVNWALIAAATIYLTLKYGGQLL